MSDDIEARRRVRVSKLVDLDCGRLGRGAGVVSGLSDPGLW